MAAATVDVGYLAASYSVPDTTFQSLLSAPTVELVQSLLTQIGAKARAYDDLQSEKLRADVELEAAVQGGEQRARSLKTAAEKAQKEADELRHRLAQEETARQQVETKLRNLETTTSSSTAEVQTLQSRIKTLEAHNRDAIAMHEAKVAAHDRLATELSEQHQKSVDLRKQLSALEEANQTLENAATSVRFRETNLQQEIEQLRKNNEWYTAELKTRSDDHAKSRKEKNAQVAQLQRDNAEAADTTDSLRRTETLLRQHLDEIKTKAEEDRRRIEELEGSAAKVESDFRIELDSARRLATLHQQTGDSAKKRLQELQGENERLQNDAANEVGLLQAEIEMERNKANEAEGRAAELETLVETMQSEAADLKASVRVPGTPRHGMNGAYGTPVRAGSPAVFSPGGSQMRGGSSAQALKENIDLRNEVRKLRLKVDKQSIVLQEMIEELEGRQPEFEDLRRGNEALTAQNTELSNYLEDAISEREAARKDARKALGDLEGLHNECNLLRHQTQDMTIQLRSLIWRREAEKNGLDSLPAEQKQFILTSVNNQVPPEHLQNDSATHNEITKHLVLYKDVSELQFQNSELLRTIRTVGEAHETEEARRSTTQQQKDHEELVQLRTSVAEKDEEIQSFKLRSKTFKSERDMYYRMTVGRQTHPDATSAFAQSLPAAGTALQIEGAPQSRVVPEYDNLIKDLQAHINLLKDESTTNTTASRAQVDSLSKDNTQLQSDRLRLESQVRREQDRYTRLESTIRLLQSEKDTLQERYNHAQANYAQRDDRAVKAEQDLADSVSRLQGLESELVNLRATQNMSKTIEARLNERVKELTDERDRLNKMVAEIQSLRNEQELSNADNRRRLQASHDKLEAELQIARRKLEDEVADHRKTAGQRDYERTETQRRLDDLVTARNNAEVKSATADSTRQQLEQRIKDLHTQLQSAEERVQSLQPRPTPRVNGSESEDDEAISREEELTKQLSDLQRKMQYKQEDLEAANADIKSFQEIAQDAEERLQSFIEAHERLQTELDLAQQEKDATIQDLQQRVDEISSELAATTTELTELRGSHEQETLQLIQQKDSLEAEITRLNNDVADYKAEADAQSELVKTQADIATRAQKDYEHELAKHGETMKKYRVLYDDNSKIQTEIAQSNAQAVTAKNILEQSKEHWKTTQDQFEGQLEEAKRRHDDLKQYNTTLLRQFDDYKAQIDNLKNDRIAAATGEVVEPGSRNMQDLEVYLRREKEILEVQFNLKDQEVKRLEQQLTHFQHQLDQTREKLIAEQSKGQGSTSASTLQNLHEQVEQLNLFRESNTTLRSDNGRLQTQVTEKTKELDDIRNQLEPLQDRVTELEGELELSNGHLKAVEEDRDRWQKRHQDVLQRYDRIDPKELEDLKQQIENSKVERDQAVEDANGLKEKIQAVEAARESIINETREATIVEVRKEETTKARTGFNKVHNEKMAQKKVEIDKITAERDEVQTQLANIQQEYEGSRLELATAQTELSQAQLQVTIFQQQSEQTQIQLTAVQQELAAAKTANPGTNASVASDVHMSEDGQVDEGNATNDQLQKLQKELEESRTRATEAQGRANAADGKAGSLAVQLSLMKDRVSGLDKEVAEKGNRILELQNQLSQGETQSAQPIPTSSTDSSSEIQTLKDELTTARKTIEDLRTQLDAVNAAKPSSNEVAKTDAPEADEQTTSIKAALDQREAELNKLETNLNTKSQKVLEKANRRVKEIREETNKEIDRLKTAHQDELERVQQEQQTANASSAAPAQETSQASAETTVPVPEDMIDTQTLARPSITITQFRDWLNEDAALKRVFATQVRKHVDVKEKELGGVITTLTQEIEDLKTNRSADTETTTNPASDQANAQKLEQELAKAKADYEKNLKDALEKEKQGWIQRGKDEEGKRFNVKMSMANRKTDMANDKFETVNVKWQYVQKVAKETPEQQVGLVHEQADQQKPPPKPAAPASTPAKPQAPAAAQQQAGPFQTGAPAPFQAQQNTGIPSVAPQSNGTNAAFGQQPNPFMQGQQAGVANPFLQAQNTMGRGIPQPGFTGQLQNPQMLQQSQHGRGRGDGVGTGPQALRGVLSQNNLRGGASSIPMPGGRGRGQQPQPQPQQQQPGQQGLPGANAIAQAGGGVSQIGRGGNRAAGRGRGGLGLNVQGQTGGGGGAQGQSSPRGGMNPGATHFQPGGGGGGRGQKRNADDEGEGVTRGGKRQQRGGRGGQGGGAGAGGAPPAGGE